MPTANLPKGFISVDDAIKLIHADKRDNATVDMRFLVNNILYIEKAHNFTIKLMKTENPGTPQMQHIENGQVWVQVNSDFEKFALRKAIEDHYKDATGRALKSDELGLRSVTAAVDEQKNVDGRPMINTDSKIKYADAIKEGTFEVEE